MELLIRVGSSDGNHKTYQDGDVVQTFSMDRILRSHANNICNPKNFSLDSTTGLRHNNSLLMKYMENKSVHRFERVNKNEVKRTVIETGDEDILSDVPNINGEHLYIDQFLSRKLKNANHCIFGSTGKEIWYGQTKKNDVDSLWNDIETHTDNLKQDHTSWLFSDTELRGFLVLNSCIHHNVHDHQHSHSDCLCCSCSCNLYEVSDEIACERCCSIYSDGDEILEPETGIVGPYNARQKILVAIRKYNVPYWDYASSLSLNVDDVRNKSIKIDGRKPLQERPTYDALTIDKVSHGIVSI